MRTTAQASIFEALLTCASEPPVMDECFTVGLAHVRLVAICSRKVVAAIENYARARVCDITGHSGVGSIRTINDQFAVFEFSGFGKVCGRSLLLPESEEAFIDGRPLLGDASASSANYFAET